MTQESVEDERGKQISDILAVDETRTGIVRQIFNGVGGLLLLLVTGLVVVMLVLWKAQ